MTNIINATGINWIDIGYTFIFQDFIGNPFIAGLVLIILLLIFLAILSPRREIILLVPAPAIIAIADSLAWGWIKITIWIIAGMYLGLIIKGIVERDIF